MQLTSKRVKLTLSSGGSETMLLEGELRGKVEVDGSYWSIEDLPPGCKPTRPEPEVSDSEGADNLGDGMDGSDSSSGGNSDSSSESDSNASGESSPPPDTRRFGDGGGRTVVLTMEKKEGGEFDPEDWMGVVLDVRENQAVSSYELPEREEFDIDEYIESMGGYNESLVDKTMFSDISKNLANDLMKSGLLKDGDANMTDVPPDTEAQVVDSQVAMDEGEEDIAAIDDVAPAAPSNPANKAGKSLTVAALKAELSALGLPVSGNKAALAERLASAQGDADSTVE
jgi:hypothetical protein